MAAVRGQFSEPAKRFTSEEVLSYFFIDESVVESDEGDSHCQMLAQERCEASDTAIVSSPHRLVSNSIPSADEIPPVAVQPGQTSVESSISFSQFHCRKVVTILWTVVWWSHWNLLPCL
jgi:hypothetical protein